MNRNSPAALALQAISEELRRDFANYCFWSRFTGDINKVGDKRTNDPENFRPSGAVIDKNPGIKSHGIGDRMLIPLQMHLAGPATYGDATLIGNEESIGRKWAHVAYNTVRHATTIREGEMDELRENYLKAADYVRGDEAIWHAQMHNFFVTQAFMEGVSENLSTIATDDVYGEGLGIQKRYHPNYYVYTGAGNADAAGTLTRIGATGKFPTAAQIFNAAANQNQAGGADLNTELSFSSRLVRLARNLAIRHLRPLFTWGGTRFYGWMISPEQATSLMNDTTYKDVMNSQQYAALKDHPWVSGSVGVFSQFVFFEDATAVRGWAGTGAADLNIMGSVEMLYDKENKQNPRFLPMEGMIKAAGGTKSNQVSIIFGAGALGQADARPLAYSKPEEIDYGNWQGLATKTVYGISRTDFVPESLVDKIESDVANLTSVYNQSSILVQTWELV